MNKRLGERGVEGEIGTRGCRKERKDCKDDEIGGQM